MKKAVEFIMGANVSNITKAMQIMKGDFGNIQHAIDQINGTKLDLNKQFKKGTLGADKLNQELNKMDNNLKKLRKSQDRLEGFKNMKSTGASKLMKGSAMALGLGYALKPVIEFEQAVKNVKEKLNSTPKEFKAINDEIRRLGRSTTFNPTEVANSMEMLVQANYKKEDLLNSMEYFLNLSSASQTDVKDTADIASNIQGTFEIATNKVEHLTDVLIKGTQSGNVNLLQMGEAVKNAGLQARTAGISLEQTVAMAAKLGDVGIQGGEAGTGISAMLRELSKKDKGEQLKNLLGVSARDEAGKLRDIPTILEEIHEASKKVENDKGDIFNQIFGDEGAKAALAITSKTAIFGNPEEDKAGLRELSEILLNDVDGFGKDLAARLNDTTLGRIKKMQGAWSDLLIEITPSLMKLVRVITDMMTKITQLAGEHPLLAKSVLFAVAGFTALNLVLGGLFSVIGTLGIAFTKTKNILKWMNKETWLSKKLLKLLRLEKLNAILINKAYNVSQIKATHTTKLWRIAQKALNWAMRMSPIGLMITGIGLLVAAGIYLWKNWDTVKEVMINVWDSIKNAFNTAIDWIVGYLPKIGETIAMVLFPIPYLIIKHWDTISEFLTQAGESIKNFFIEGVWGSIKEFGDSLIEGIMSKINWLTEKWNELKGWIGFGDDEKTINIQKIINPELPVTPKIPVSLYNPASQISPWGSMIRGDQIQKQLTPELHKFPSFRSSQLVSQNQSHKTVNQTRIHKTEVGDINITLQGTATQEDGDRIALQITEALKQKEEEDRIKVSNLFAM